MWKFCEITRIYVVTAQKFLKKINQSKIMKPWIKFLIVGYIMKRNKTFKNYFG